MGFGSGVFRGCKMAAQISQSEPARLTPGGSSARWSATKANVRRIYDYEFRSSSQVLALKYPAVLVQERQEVLCYRVVYEEFCSFLLDVYVIPDGVRNAGESIASNTFLKYLAILLRLAEERFKPGADEKTLRFLCCLETGGTS